MQVHLSNSAYLGNIDPFLKSMDLGEKDSLEITFNEKWVSVHPLVLSMIATLGLSITDNSKLMIHTPEAKSKYYFERIGFFKLLGHTSGIEIVEHEASGRFIPLTIVKNSHELHKFITDMIPLLHCEPVDVEPIKYIVSELIGMFLSTRKQRKALFYVLSTTKKVTVLK